MSSSIETYISENANRLVFVLFQTTIFFICFQAVATLILFIHYNFYILCLCERTYQHFLKFYIKICD